VRVEHDVSLDEIADVHLRIVARSKVARRNRWTIWFVLTVLVGSVVFLLLLQLGATTAVCLVGTGLSITGGSAAYWLFYPWSTKRHILKLLREQVQSHGPMRFVVELRDDCVWTKQAGVQLSIDWSNVADVLDTDDGIELRMHDGGLVMVRSKGFPNAKVRREFKELAMMRMQRDSSTASRDGERLRAADRPVRKMHREP